MCNSPAECAERYFKVRPMIWANCNQTAVPGIPAVLLSGGGDGSGGSSDDGSGGGDDDDSSDKVA
eukprot:gene1-biopygen3374